MKGRAQRAAAEAPEDWGDGAWTVDCSCGVTFDDGEEMVSCDECGVWVHTRCARFTRGQPSFACHKCKRRASTPSDDAEETEVAQLLVELPTKAGADPGPPQPLPGPRRPPFRLWAEVPMEERVHVQGVPGGDPALFRGLSSVFTSQLWKCAGYVPKKFNFKYKEFPCWEEEAVVESKKADEEEEGENPASRGANVLFSLSKEIVPYVPAVSLDRWPLTEMSKKRDGGKVLYGSRSQSSGKRERSKLRVFGVHSGKRRKDESGDGNDRSTRKKARSMADGALSDDGKRGSGPLLDMNKADSCGDRAPQIDESNIQEEKKEDDKEDVSSEAKVTSQAEGFDSGRKPKHILVVKASRGSLSDKASRQKGSVESPMKVEQGELLEPLRTESLSNVDASGPSRGEGSDHDKVSVKEEDLGKTVHGFRQPKDESYCEGDSNGGYCHVMVDSERSDCISDDHRNISADASMVLDSDGTILSSKQDKIKAKIEGGKDQSTSRSELLSCVVPDKKHHVDISAQSLQRSMDCLPDDLQRYECIRNLPYDEHKSQDANRESEAVNQGSEKTTDEAMSKPSELLQVGQSIQDSAGPLTEEKTSNHVDGPMTSAGTKRNSQASGEHKSVVGIGKAALTSQVLSKSVSCEIPGTIASSTSSKVIHFTKQQRVKLDVCSTGKKDEVATTVSSEESMREVSRQPAKDHRKGSLCSVLKSSQVSSISNASASGSASKLASADSTEKPSNPPLADSNEKLPSSSPSISDNMAMLSGLAEAPWSSQSQIASSVQIKLKSLSSSQKNERLHPPIPQSSTKVLNHSTSMHPPASVNVTAALSDEELALLLHQELNSSPRVPRVPRVRQAAGMQLASPTGTSILKRSSSSGGKDHISVSRRKSKEDGSRHSYQNPRDVIGETKRIGRLNSSHDQKHQDSTCMTDGSSKNDARNRSPDTATYVKKNIAVASTAGTKSCSSSPFEVNRQNVLPVHSSPRCVSDDDNGLAPCTLPGLIGEIISKNREITLKQICDAVHPHWHNLRKPNGDRYAYSSHSQAVLDCLRNRSEWAHLIDRGPKTNSSKRRRKADTEAPTLESENEEAKDKVSKGISDKNGESHHEDVPKGKGKAQKHRRLELRGRAVKDRKRRKQGTLSDDDCARFSHSSNEDECPFSEDESLGTGRHAGIAESSSSSSDDDAA